MNNKIKLNPFYQINESTKEIHTYEFFSSLNRNLYYQSIKVIPKKPKKNDHLEIIVMD